MAATHGTSTRWASSTSSGPSAPGREDGLGGGSGLGPLVPEGVLGVIKAWDGGGDAELVRG